MKPIIVTGRVLPISEATKARNPELYGLGAVGAEKPKPAPRRALVQNIPRRPESQGRLACLVTIVAYRNVLLDRDNSAAGYKPLQDSIAASLCVDDGASNIKFTYDQVKTEGAEGTSVRIEWV